MTARLIGESSDLLPKYAWFSINSQERTWPVGTLKPNDLGFFDIQGNTFTWCQETYKPYPSASTGEASEDREDDLPILGARDRVLRGVGFLNQAGLVRSAYRTYYVPTTRSYNFGCRIARTLPVSGPTALAPAEAAPPGR